MGCNPAVHLSYVKLKAFVIVMSRSSNVVKTREHFEISKSTIILYLLFKMSEYVVSPF